MWTAAALLVARHHHQSDNYQPRANTCATQIRPLACARPPAAGDKRRVSTSAAMSHAGFAFAFTLTAEICEMRRGEIRRTQQRRTDYGDGLASRFPSRFPPFVFSQHRKLHTGKSAF